MNYRALPLFLAAAAGCTSEYDHLGPSFPEDGTLPHLVAEPSDITWPAAETTTDTPGITLSELADGCITKPLNCNDGDTECETINTQIISTGDELAAQLSDHYGVPVTAEGVFAGDHDSEIQMTIYAWDVLLEESNGEYAGIIAIPGEVAKADMRNRVSTDTYYADPLKCNRALVYDPISSDLTYKNAKSGFSVDGSGTTFFSNSELTREECWPGAGQDCILTIDDRFEDGTDTFASANDGLEEASLSIEELAAEVVAEDQASSEPADLNNGEVPVVTTTLI